MADRTFHDPDGEEYRGFRMKVMHAVIAIDPVNDSEGVCSVPGPLGPIPLISSDRVRLEEIVLIAQRVADVTRMNFKVVRFAVREDIAEIKSRTTS